MPPQDAKTKSVEFEGTTHVFPADFTDDDIRKALATQPKTETNPTTGIVTPAGSTGDDSSSILGGAARRAGSAISSTYHTFMDPPQSSTERAAATVLPGAGPGIVRAAKGFGQTEAQAAGQVKQQVKSRQYARAAVTGASMLDPFATGSVTNINTLEDQGRNREAIGAGAFDAISLWLGNKLGKEPSPGQTLDRVTAAVGDTGTSLERAIPDIADTAKLNGAPKTIGDLYDNVKATDKRIASDYAIAKAPVGNKPIIPNEISKRILALETPDMKMTAEGRAEIKQIRAAALDYQKPWTIDQLDAARMRKNSELNAYYNKSSMGQSAAAKSHIDVGIDKAIRDGAAEASYREIERANPSMSPGDIQKLKLRQQAIWDLKDHLEDHVTKLTNAERAQRGKTISQKLHTGVSVGQHGTPHGYISRVADALPGGGPLADANTNVRRAFAPSAKGTTGRAAVLASPITRLGEPVPQSKGLPPPPERSDDDE